MERIFESYLQLIKLLLIQKHLKISDLNKVKFSYSWSNLNKVKSEKPLTDWELVDCLNLGLGDLLCVFESLEGLSSILQKMTLKLGHWQFVFWKTFSKLNCLLPMIREELSEQIFHLKGTCVIELDLHVASTWSQKSWIEFFSVVSCHNQDPSFLRSDTVKCIQESWECNSSGASSSSNAIGVFSFDKDTINVFEENDRVLWGIVQSSIQAIVTKLVPT